jgi:hypothetical protein
MTWCDKLASTPTVGLKFDWLYVSSAKLLDCFASLLERLHVGDQPAFGLDTKDDFSITFTTNEGIQYSVNPHQLSLSFVPRVKWKYGEGGVPAVELLSATRPYSELLPVMCQKLAEAAQKIPAADRRVVKRIGIVSNTLVQESEFPPGIAKMVTHFGQPWKSPLETYNLQLSAELTSAAEWTDRCIHTLVKPEDTGTLPSLAFDWQRSFKRERHLSTRALSDQLEAAQKAALEYFEELAVGSMFDENSDCIPEHG